MVSKSKKGQAAMEYLMTYGWAILVIVIVLVVLVSFLPQFLRTPESCIFTESGFSCQDVKPVIVAGPDGAVSVTYQLNNYQGQQVQLDRVMCTTAPAGNIAYDMAGTHEASEFMENTNIASGGSRVIGNPETHERLPCVDEEGDQVVIAPNSDFNGNLVIWYEYQNEVPGAPLRKANAVLNGPVLEETG
jgi:hypothetical protein